MANIRKKQVIRSTIGMFILLIMLFICGISLGYSSVSFDRILPILLGDGSFKEEFILFSVRLPRVIVLALAGMGLALSGAILQTLTRNDLADPGIIGINAGAGIAITVFYIFAEGNLTNYPILLPVIGFIGAMLTATVIFLFAFDKQHGIRPVSLVLIGVGFASAFSGLMMILISGAERADVQFIAKWLSGNIWGVDWPFILGLLPWLLIAFPLLFFKAKAMNLLALNESVARGLGVNIQRERIILLILAVALAASAVSITGSISFVGLIAPHIAKRLVGAKHQSFLFLAPMIGASLLILADTIGRTIYSEATIPAGIVVAVIGAPYFLYLLHKAK